MSTQMDRQLRPVYDALDTGSNKTAVLACNKLLKKLPNNNLIKALKALALVRTQKLEESLVLCDEVLASKTTDDATLSAMMLVLRGLGRHTDMITMFEEAYKRQPNNEDLGIQTFFANVRTGNWKAAQQISAKMHKQFHKDIYIYWSVISAGLQANDPTTPPAMRDILFKLSHRLLASTSSPSYISADRFYLHLSVLRELRLWDEAYELLNNDLARLICETSLICDGIRRDIWANKGLWKEEGQKAQKQISEKGDRNWLEFLAVLDGTFSDLFPLPDGTSPSGETERIACARLMTRSQEFLARVAQQDGKRDRSGPLALLELEKRARGYSLSTDRTALQTLLTTYFSEFGEKACCFEDLKPYTMLEGDDLVIWTSYLESLPRLTATINDLQRTINIEKFLRHSLPTSELTEELEMQRAGRYLQSYLEGLRLGEKLPETEIQPADDLIILYGQTLVNVWRLTKDESYLYRATVTLEFALNKSLQCYQIRLLLIRIYRVLGAPSLALEHYRGLNLKQIQHDTLSHFLLSRASTFSLVATGDLTYSTECSESSQIYIANSTETAEFIIRAFSGEKYSQIPEFIEFEDRLDNSLQRDLAKMEHVRMRIVHDTINSDLTDMELIELKFIFDRLHHDNRDYEILMDYQPRCLPSFNTQTLLFDREPGLGWLHVFLKIYIQAFQQASDLDDSVEEKLLVGDRPKQTNDPGRPLKERLAQRSKIEEAELTAHELLFFNYTIELAEWLEPFHDYARPPPSTVLAEAVKQSELKTGKALKGIEMPSENGNTNGNPKKEEETPPVTPPPELVNGFFDDMQKRFDAAIEADSLPPELLHIASLTQEALILLTIETGRFKSASVVKVHKLGGLVQGFKDIRAKAVSVLRHMSTKMSKVAEQIGCTERREAFAESCHFLSGLPQIGSKIVTSCARKFVEDRKKVLDGFAKGMLKVAMTHG